MHEPFQQDNAPAYTALKTKKKILRKRIYNLGKLASSVARYQYHRKIIVNFAEKCPKKTYSNFVEAGDICGRGILQNIQ